MSQKISDMEKKLLRDIETESTHHFPTQENKMQRIYANGFGPNSSMQEFLKRRPPAVFLSILFTAIIFSTLFAVVSYKNSKIISNKNIITKQISGALVNGDRIKWVKLVKLSDIKKGQKYLIIPKQATNITIKKLNQNQTIALIKTSTQRIALTLKDRQLLAIKSSPELAQKFSKSIARSNSLIPRVLFDIETSIGEIINNQDSQQTQQIDISAAIAVPWNDAEINAEPRGNDKEEKEKPVEQLETITETPTPETNIQGLPLDSTNIQGLPLDSTETEKTEKEKLSEQLATGDETPTPETNIQGLPLDSTVTTPTPTPTPTPNPDDYIAVEYETPAPTISEQDTSDGKLVTVSTPAGAEDQANPVTNVLAFTTIPEIYKVGQENKIQIKWKNNGDQPVTFTAYDLNKNGKLDYLEWTVPHLSEQIFQIIFISKAFQLDQNKEIIADIFDIVKEKDNNYATVSQNNYVRVTFEKELTNINDITIYAKPTNPDQSATVEVYEKDGTTLIATFPEITTDEKYKIILNNLTTPTDTFDLKIVSSSTNNSLLTTHSIDIDYIVDPVITWDGGGGADTNWNTATNWSGDAVPGTSDIATFDATSTNNVTINVNISVAGIDINTGYTGTITQSSGITVTVGTSKYDQADGTFTGSAAAITLNGTFTLSGGTFTATSGTLSVGVTDGGANTFFSISGGTFNHNSGTVVLKGYFFDTIDVVTSLTLNNVTFQEIGGGSGVVIASGDTIIVLGTLTHTSGVINGTGTIEARGNITIASTAEGGNGTISFLVADDQTITGTGGLTAGLSINKSSGTVSAGTTNLTIATFTLASGTFTSTSGTLSVGVSDGGANTFFSISGGTFDHNSGTVVLKGYSIDTIDVVTSLTLNNVTFQEMCCTSGVIIASGDTIIVLGNLIHTSGVINGPGTIEARGDITIASTAEGGNGILTFTGTNAQTYTDNGGTKTSGLVTVNKTSGIVTLATAMSYNTAGQDLTITAGTLDLAGFNLTVNDVFTLGASGTLQLQGGETVSTIDTVTAGSTVIYNGTSSYLTALAAGNTYSNLTFNGVGGIWEPSAAVTVNSNLTITNGTLDIDGQNLTVTSTFSNLGTLRLTGGETTVSLTNDTDSGTTEYDGTGTYSTLKAGNTYNNIIFNGTGSWTAAAATTVNGNFTLSGGTFTSTSGTLTVGGNNTGGNWTHTAGGTFAHNNGSVKIQGTNTITADVNTTETFYNLEYNCRAASNCSAGGNYALTIASGDTLVVANTFTLTDGNILTGTVNVQGNMTVGSNVSNGAGGSSAGTIEFTVAGDQVITSSGGFSIPKLLINKSSGTVSVSGSDLAASSFELAGGTFTAPSGTFYLGASGTNSASSNNTWTHTVGGTFNHNSGTVKVVSRVTTFDVNTTETFNNFEYDSYNTGTNGGSSGCIVDNLTITSGDTLIIEGTFTYTDGCLQTGTVEAKGGVTVATIADGGSALLKFSGSNDQTYTDSGGNEPDGLVTINKSSGTVTLASNADWNATSQNTTITSGTLDLAGYTIATGTLTVSSGGTLQLQGGETVTATTKTFSSGSTVIYNGTSSYLTALAAGNTYSNLTFNGVGGIWEPSAAVTVGANLTITNGTLDIDGQNLTVTSTFSNLGTLRLTGGETTVSLTNDTDSGTTEYDGTGTYTTLKAGNTYNNVIFNGVGSWTADAATNVNNILTITAGTLSLGSQTLTLSGTTGTPLSNSGTFTASTGTVSYTGNNASGNTTVANVTYYNLILNNGSETFVLSANTTANNNLTITAGTLDAVSGSNYILSVGGTWSNSGTFTPQNGTLTLTGTSTFSDTMSFYNITINGSTKTVTLGAALTTTNNLTITAGTLDVSASNYGVSVGGIWSNSGTFTPRSGTLTLTGTSTFSDTMDFYNITVNGSTKTVTLGAALTATNNLTITAGTLDVSASNYGVSVGGPWSRSGTFTPRSGTLTLTGTSNVPAVMVKLLVAVKAAPNVTV